MSHSTYGRFSGGVSVAGMPLLNSYSGSVFWVDSNGGGGPRGTFHNPCLTIAAAMDLCTASKGDIIMIKAGHAEAPAATIDIDVAGVSLIGCGNGRNRPTITHAHTVDHDHVFEISAANTLIKNIRFAAGTNTGGHSEQINISANDVTIEDCVIEMGAANEIGMTVEGNKHRFRILNCLFLGTGSTQADTCISLEGSGQHDDYIIRNCDFNFLTAGGLDVAAIGSAKLDTGFIIEDCTFIECDAAAIDFDSTAEGIIRRCSIHSAKTTIDEVVDVGSAMLDEVRIGGAGKTAVAHSTATLAD